MTVQLLLSTMNQADFSILNTMNIFADTVVINQSNKTGYHRFKCGEHTIDWYDCEERGIGISRNKALMYATADICVFADDDMIYNSESLEYVKNAFEEYNDASLLIFNVQMGEDENLYIKNAHKISEYNAFHYGAVRFAVRRKAILKERIAYSLFFGGGAEYSCGEDTLFIADCLKRNLKIYAVPYLLGKNIMSESTWFKGYNEKFYMDKGILFYSISRTKALLYCIYFAIKNKKNDSNNVSSIQILRWMYKGIMQYKRWLELDFER